ncbi:MAG TPA: DMT family transporter [Anaerolineaceae bacterium]|jgi:drug/metabolite transporter (DMT)-like permease|nr:DMT family transporter [Anaerolineaceae bacterium]
MPAMKRTVDRLSSIPGEVLLLTAAIIWGSGFVAQRKAMDGMQPFAFIALRFFLGCLVLSPALIAKVTSRKLESINSLDLKVFLKRQVLPGVVMGMLMFAGTSMQQLGIMTTSAAKAGFLTSLYLVLVPIMGLFMGKKSNRWVWMGMALALTGVYFLSVDQQFSIQSGDILMIIGALFWAMQILALDHFGSKMDSLELAFGQFLVTAILGLIVSLISESGPMIPKMDAWVPLLYSGVIAVGIGFTLQVFGQSKVDPALAALIMSLEAVFALLGGMLLLGERLSGREWFGCVLMLAGVILVQLRGQQQKPDLTSPDPMGSQTA